jgi:hypothetical protein
MIDKRGVFFDHAAINRWTIMMILTLDSKM